MTSDDGEHALNECVGFVRYHKQNSCEVNRRSDAYSQCKQP